MALSEDPPFLAKSSIKSYKSASLPSFVLTREVSPSTFRPRLDKPSALVSI